ncbi:hypothetical protein H0H87_007901 [Tephrocybe sp. NHM501043]|nr:hypothetical protein H0H87_007901 [Tephrocybe sp. NHM501043]
MSTHCQLAAQMPTPPFSPSPTDFPHSDGSLQSTLNLLDSLEDFYRNQRAWIEQARAALDQAFEESEGLQFEQSSLPSPPVSESDVTGSITGRSDNRSDEEHWQSLLARPDPTLGARKKKGLQLAETIQSRRSPPYKRVRRITSRNDLNQRKQMLNMMDEVVQARMDSCKIAYRMVRNANSRIEPQRQ